MTCEEELASAGTEEKGGLANFALEEGEGVGGGGQL